MKIFEDIYRNGFLNHDYSSMSKDDFISFKRYVAKKLRLPKHEKKYKHHDFDYYNYFATTKQPKLNTIFDALEYDWKFIVMIKNPNDEIIQYAIEQYAYSIVFVNMDNIPIEFIKYAVMRDYAILRCIKQPFELLLYILDIKEPDIIKPYIKLDLLTTDQIEYLHLRYNI